MGEIKFTGEGPFVLKTQQGPTAFALGKTVVLTFPVFVADIPDQTEDAEMSLSLPHAQHLLTSLEQAIAIALRKVKRAR
jgi:hypothetical protein